METENSYSPEPLEQKQFEFDFQELESKATNFFNANKDELDDDEDIKNAIEGFVSAEKVFTEKIIKSLEDARRDNPEKKIVFLFDVDETLVKSDFQSIDGETTKTTHLRPTALPLLDYLKNQNVHLGLLTSRGNLEAQLEDPSDLQALSPYLDKDLLFSSRDMEDYEALEIVKNNKKILHTDKDPDEVIEDIKGEGSFPKVGSIVKIIAENPKTIYIPVDDDLFYYPKLIKYGVSLWKDEDSPSGIFNKAID